MKNFPPLLLVCLIITFVSCQTGLEAGVFKLLPLPRSMEITGTSDLMADDIVYCFGENGIGLPVVNKVLSDIEQVGDRSEAQVIIKIDPSLKIKNEGYILVIEPNRIHISGKDSAGLFYGFMTLSQLMTDATDQEVPLPLCNISDFPQLSYRAVHLDMKHHMEKRDYYYRLIDKLALYKVNAIIAEVEDKLGYERRPLVGSEDALSMAEWKKLSEYAWERHIEISPLVQGLGHASFILKHPQYAQLRDDPASDWAFNPLDPGTYELQYDLYRDAMEAMPHGRYLHVGGDEVHTTGRNSGRTALDLQLEWLDRVCKFAESYGRTPIFWDDMPIKLAGLYRPMFDTTVTRRTVDSMWLAHEQTLLNSIDRFPGNCIYMRWNYSASEAEGNMKAMEWFRDHGMRVMGATAGQTRWVLMPQNESNMQQIGTFARISAGMGMEGLLLTLWDDDSPHFELYWRGIIAFAEYTWSGDQRSRDEVKSAYRHREFSPRVSGKEFGFVETLERSAAWWNGSLLSGKRRNFLRTMDDPLHKGVIPLPSPDAPGNWSEKHANLLARAEKVIEHCDTIAETITRMKSMASRNHHRLEVYEQVNSLVRFSANALLELKAFDLAGDAEEKKQALNRVMDLRSGFVKLRSEMEKVYGQTRILTKPEGYLLDQDHHHHLANQTLSFDWQYTAELAFLEKLDRWTDLLGHAENK